MMLPIELELHIADLPGWQGLVAGIQHVMKETGLWDRFDHIHLSLHYNPSSYTEWLDRLRLDSRITWRFTERSARGLAEIESMIWLNQRCRELKEPRAILRYHSRGLRYINAAQFWPIAQQWNRYIEYWTIHKWPVCHAAISAGFDTVGANWQHNSEPQGHWSGNCWWAHSDYLARLEPLLDPSDPHRVSQFGAADPRQDAELWIGRGSPRRLELDRHEYAVCYVMGDEVLPKNYHLPHDHHKDPIQ